MKDKALCVLRGAILILTAVLSLLSILYVAEIFTDEEAKESLIKTIQIFSILLGSSLTYVIVSAMGPQDPKKVDNLQQDSSSSNTESSES